MPIDLGISGSIATDLAGERSNGVGQTEAPIIKQVSVMMPFGGDDKTRRCRCVLDFMRIRYQIENRTSVVNKNLGRKISYRCMVFLARVGDIPRDGMRVVAKSDILIGLVSEPNVNVIYELAVRNLLKDEMLLILNGERSLLPVYLQSMPYVAYDGSQNSVISSFIDTLSREVANLDFEDEIPPELKEKIDKHDDQFKKYVNRALDTIENNCPPRQSYILDLVQDLDPGLLLGTWDTYTPYSVVQIRWKTKSGPGGYLPEDMDGPPIVYSANDEFRFLFNMASDLPDPNGPNPFTSGMQLERITPFLRAGNLEAFIEDQTRLSSNIIFGDGFDQAKVPLEITADHPRAGYKNKVFLPCMIGKRTVGDNTDAPHMTYLLITFIEDFFPQDEEPEKASAKAKEKVSE